LKNQTPLTIPKDAPTVATYDKNLEPGHTYSINVKTFSDKVPSWTTSANVTTRPLPVQNVVNTTDSVTGDILIEWTPDLTSKQDHYRVIYRQ
jgi:receptor-type tyrosine-protein phosphatase beta